MRFVTGRLITGIVVGEMTNVGFGSLSLAVNIYVRKALPRRYEFWCSGAVSYILGKCRNLVSRNGHFLIYVTPSVI